MQEPAIPEIEWFRTVYVIPEDRLRFACALKGGGSDVFWVTQRVANELVKSLLDWLDKTVQEERLGDVVHSFAQQSAVASKPKRQPPRLPDTPGWLVHAVNARTLPDRVTLTFRNNAGRAACIHFDAVHLRRWLNVLHGQYRRSGWPLDLWPDWMAEAEGTPETADPGRLH
ncbi:MAG: hypothetical protein ACM3YM_11855 [Sphingomonadales bacterium]